MRKSLPILITALGSLWFSACQNNSSQTDITDTANSKVQSMDGFVASGSDFVITPTKRPDMHVICKVYMSVKPETLKTLIIGTASELNTIIADSARIMTGPIMAIYEQIPEPGKEQNIIIGIPINKPIKNNQFGFINLKAGPFHKAKTMAALGQSAPFWIKVSENLKSQGYKLEPPFIEYPSDTRTGEMTTVVTNSNLLIPVVKP